MFVAALPRYSAATFMRSIAAAVLGTVLIVPAAEANESFHFVFEGPGNHVYNAYECPNTVCDSFGYDFTWTGAVDVEMVSAVDGVHTGDDIVSFSLTSNRGGFMATGSEHYPISPVVATTAAGQIVSLNVTAGAASEPYYTRYELRGLTATYAFGGCHHCGTESAVAALIPAIPEPSVTTLLLTGLSLSGACLRRRRRHQRSDGGWSRNR